MNTVRFLLLALLAGLFTFACSHGPAITQSSVRDVSAGCFTLQQITDPLLVQSTGQLALDCREDGDGAVAEVRIAGARGLKSLYFRLQYDASLYAPVSVQAQGLEQAGRAVSYSVLSEPGVVFAGQVLVHAGDVAGWDGSGVVAAVAFKRRALGEAAGVIRAASLAPRTSASRAQLVWTQATQMLAWHYANLGDYNQDGTVGITDLTPLGMHFNDIGPFDYEDSRSLVDGNGDGSINIVDLAAIGINFNVSAAGGYRIFEAADTTLYPAYDLEADKLNVLASVPFSAAAGDPAKQRKHFTYTVVAPLAQAYYWVRPVDGGGQPGTPSVVAGGDTTLAPYISIAAGLTGHGTAADPYIIASGISWAFAVMDPTDGDVTANPLTKYVVSPSAAIGIDAAAQLLAFDEYAIGTVALHAVYDNWATPEVVFRVPPPFDWTGGLVDAGDPPGDAVGLHCSMADINGYPSIAYYDVSIGILRYAYYTATPISAWHASTVDAVPVVGRNCTLMENNGRPVICYLDQTNSALKFALGANDHPAGLAEWTTYIVGPDVYPMETSMCTINGNVVIVFNDVYSDNLTYTRSYEDHPDDITDWVWHKFASCGDMAAPCVRAVDGTLGVAYYDDEQMDLRYCYSKTSAPYSSSDWVLSEVDTGGAVGISPSLYAMDGLLPVIAYYDWTDTDLKFAQAKKSKPNGQADWTLSYIVQDDDNIGNVVRMDAVRGHLCAAFANYSDESIWFARNKTPFPTGPQDWQAWEAVAGPNLGEYLSLAELYGPVNGVAGIAYYNKTTDDLYAMWSNGF